MLLGFLLWCAGVGWLASGKKDDDPNRVSYFDQKLSGLPKGKYPPYEKKGYRITKNGDVIVK